MTRRKRHVLTDSHNSKTQDAHKHTHVKGPKGSLHPLAASYTEEKEQVSREDENLSWRTKRDLLLRC